MKVIRPDWAGGILRRRRKSRRQTELQQSLPVPKPSLLQVQRLSPGTSKSQFLPGLAGLVILTVLMGGCRPDSEPTPGEGSGEGGLQERANPSAVVLISIDTLRADRLGCYGNSKTISPELDRMAQESVVFLDNLCQAPVTLPSHSSLFTSQYPNGLGIFSDESSPPIPTNRRTIIEYMKQQGYRTLSFTGGGFVDSGFGFGRGVDFLEQDDYMPHKMARLMEELDRYAQRVKELREQRAARAESGERPTPEAGGDDDGIFVFFHTYKVHMPFEYVSEFRNLLEDQQYYHRFLELYREAATKYANDDDLTIEELTPEDAIILFLGWQLTSKDFADIPKIDRYNFLTIHSDVIVRNWLKSPEYEHQLSLMSGIYDITVRSVDRALGKLFRRLRLHELWDEALVIVLSDHGEEFMEHAMLGHSQEYYYQNLIHVPLLIKYPGSWNIAPGLVEARSTNLDILPTIAEVCRFSLDPGTVGDSLVPLSRTKAQVGGNDAPVISEAFDHRRGAPIVMIRDGDYKAVRNQQGGYLLFDIHRDPLETEDISGRRPEILAPLKEQIENHIQAMEALKAQSTYPPPGSRATHKPEVKSKTKVDPELQERLRELGYVQ